MYDAEGEKPAQTLLRLPILPAKIQTLNAQSSHQDKGRRSAI
jgi:hypothetical protein